MPKGIRICKVCGAEYEYCATARTDGAFRYQDVACCPEHGAEYFRLIAISRGEAQEEKPATKIAEVRQMPTDADSEPQTGEITTASTSVRKPKAKTNTHEGCAE